MSITDSESENSKSIPGFPGNRSMDNDRSPQSISFNQIKSEYDSASSDNNSVREMETFVKEKEEDTKDEVFQFLDKATGKVWNREDLNCAEDCNDVDRYPQSTLFSQIKSECESVSLDNDFDVGEMETFVKKKEEDTKDEIFQFIDETTGKVWNKEDLNFVTDCIKEETRQELLPEDKKSIPTIQLGNALQKSHLKGQVNARPYKCHLCNFGTNKSFILKIHIAGVHLNERSHKCHLCNYSANQKNNLKAHIDGVHFNEKPHKCHMCAYSSSTKQTLKSHVASIHTEKKPYKCHLCNFSAAITTILRVHITRVHLKEKYHKCHLCDYSAIRKRNLKHHILIVHEEKKKHNKCHLCDYSAFSKHNLKVHIDSVHLKEKPYKCHLCVYSATLKSNLKRHIVSIHKKEKHNKCHLCDYSVARKDSLKGHIANIHLKEKPFKCH